MTLHRRRVIVLALALVAGMMLFRTVRNLASTGSLEVVAAEYGVPGRTCTAGQDVKDRATAACGGFRPRCLVSVSNGWCGDPAPGVVKTLTVDYTCGATRKRASAPEGAGLTMSCP